MMHHWVKGRCAPLHLPHPPTVILIRWLIRGYAALRINCNKGSARYINSAVDHLLSSLRVFGHNSNMNYHQVGYSLPGYGSLVTGDAAITIALLSDNVLQSLLRNWGSWSSKSPIFCFFSSLIHCLPVLRFEIGGGAVYFPVSVVDRGLPRKPTKF